MRISCVVPDTVTSFIETDVSSAFSVSAAFALPVPKPAETNNAKAVITTPKNNFPSRMKPQLPKLLL